MNTPADPDLTSFSWRLIMTVRRNGGFTLVELLVVMAVIAILLSVLLPAITRVRASAQTTKCIANLSQIGKAHLAYVAQNDGMLVPPETMSGPRNSDNITRETWSTALVVAGFLGAYPEVTDMNAQPIRGTVFDCPASTPEVDSAFGSNGDPYAAYPTSPVDALSQRGWRAQSRANQRVVDSWYMMPSRTGDASSPFLGYRYFADKDPNRVNRAVFVASLRGTAEIMLVMDGVGGANIAAIPSTAPIPQVGLSASQIGSNRISGRHGNTRRIDQASTNVLFVDGHVENVRRTDLPYAYTDDTLVRSRGWTNLPNRYRWK
jgi:prepilin-type N-terminal cleavage/methylation domain-containing protein/prepilin-type processing-associated H-X9-DG protein